jgi:hypothetical protein
MNDELGYPEKELKTVKFIGTTDWIDKHLPIPSPAATELPDWFKQTTSYYDGNKMQMLQSGPANTIKQCMPVLDIMSTGWIQRTWSDIYIERNDQGQVYFNHSAGPDIISYRDLQSLGKMPIPEGYSDISFLWNRPWAVKTPPGHSVLYTHPFYRDDLPFRTVSAVVDTDDYHSEGKVAFFLKHDFQGIIPKGTPMYQIIPFKKDSWVGEKEERSQENIDKLEQERYDVRSVLSGGYKKEYWKRPDFSNNKCPIDHDNLENDKKED